MGRAHVQSCLESDAVDLVAVCDLIPERVSAATEGRDGISGFTDTTTITATTGITAAGTKNAQVTATVTAATGATGSGTKATGAAPSLTAITTVTVTGTTDQISSQPVGLEAQIRAIYAAAEDTPDTPEPDWMTSGAVRFPRNPKRGL